MGLEKEFNESVKDLIKHYWSVAHLSDPTAMVQCEAYKKIVSMGYNALPLIKELYEKKFIDFVSDIPNQNKIGDHHLFVGTDKTKLSSTLTELVKRNFAFKSIQALCLPLLVKGIMGDDFQIPEVMSGRVAKIEKYTQEWLENNTGKYLR